MSNAVRRSLILATVALALLGTSAWLMALERGPFVCGACTLRTPLPDADTRNFIEDQRPLIEIPFVNIGDTYVICNRVACVTYTLTASGDFVGGEIKPITDTGGGGGGSEGGSGGGGGGGGGYIGGGGCYGSCGPGTVIVKDPEPLPEKQDV